MGLAGHRVGGKVGAWAQVGRCIWFDRIVQVELRGRWFLGGPLSDHFDKSNVANHLICSLF